MDQIKPHPTPESFNMVAVTKDEFLAWLRETTVRFDSVAQHSPYIEGKVWCEYRLPSGVVIARHYNDYVGRTVAYMMRPDYAEDARAFCANPKLMPYWATYGDRKDGITYQAHSSEEALALAANFFEVDPNDTALVLHGNPKLCYSCNGIEFAEI